MKTPELPASLTVRYEPRGLLGAGGMGSVFVARDRTLCREVAVKVLGGGVIGDTELARFQREGQMLAVVSHPRIVRVFDYGVADGQPYLVMELLSGVTLARRLEAGTLPRDEARRIITAVLEGLAWMHRHGLLHRDLKPSNVFLRARTEPVLIDLGLARHPDQTAITAPGALIGTPRYFPPELARGEPYLPQSDVFQVGLIGFETLTGTHIHASPGVPDPTSVESVLSSLSSGSYFPLASSRLSDHGLVGRVLLRALAPDAASRYGDAGEMLARLEAEPEGPGAFPRPVSDDTARVIPAAAAPAAPPPVPARSAPRDGGAQRDAAPVGPGSRPTVPRGSPLLAVALAGLTAGAALLLMPLRSPVPPGAPPATPAHSASQSPPTGSPDRQRVARMAAVLERMDRVLDLRSTVRALHRQSRLPGGHDVAAGRLRSLLATWPVELAGGPLLSLFESVPAASDVRLYERLLVLHGARRLVEAARPSTHVPETPLPPHLRPGTLPDGPGRTFATSLVGLPHLVVSEFFLESESEGSGWARELSWSVTLNGLGRAKAAWVILQAARARHSEVVRLSINDRVVVGAMTGPGRSGRKRMSHSVPLWSLREGKNSFRARLDSLAGGNADVRGMESFEVVLLP